MLWNKAVSDNFINQVIDMFHKDMNEGIEPDDSYYMSKEWVIEHLKIHLIYSKGKGYALHIECMLYHECDDIPIWLDLYTVTRGTNEEIKIQPNALKPLSLALERVKESLEPA